VAVTKLIDCEVFEYKVECRCLWLVFVNSSNIQVLHIYHQCFKSLFTVTYRTTPLLRPPLSQRKNGLYSGVV